MAESLTRIIAGCAVGGAICAGVGNLLHPVSPRDDPRGVAEVIARSDSWTLIHLVIILGVVLMLAGLLGLRPSLAKDDLSDALTMLGSYAAAIGATIGVITVILDGVAAKQLANHWASAPEPDKAVALAMVSTNETINFALASMFNVAFAGIPFVLFGAAMARTSALPHWLGWTAVAAGAGSMAAGTFQAISGRPTVISLVLTIIGPTVVTAWLAAVGILLWRGTSRAPQRCPGAT